MPIGPNNPNNYTPSRIPSAFGIFDSADDSVNTHDVTLRKRSINIRLGVKKGYQYNKDIFKAGLTPGDAGTLNDATNAPSRFIGGPPYEWWTGYVIYCSSGKILNFDDTGLVSFVTSLGYTAVDVNDALLWLDGRTEYMCVNTNYQDLILPGLVLLVDFGFIPSFPRNGTYVHDLSFKLPSGGYDNDLTFSVGGNRYVSGNQYSYGGSMRFINNDLCSLPYNPNLNTSNFSIDIWFRDNGSDVIIDNSHSGTLGYVLRYGGFDLYTSGGIITINYTLQLDPPYNNLTIIYDGSFLTSYINGYYEQSVSATNYTVNDANFNIGSSTIDAYITTIKLYNRSLSSNEVLFNYNSSKDRYLSAVI